MNSLNVKKGDTVVVISGKDKGKKGKILMAQPTDERVVVQGDAAQSSEVAQVLGRRHAPVDVASPREYRADVTRGAAAVALRVDATYRDRASVPRDDTGHRLHERRLSRTVLAEKPDDLTLSQLEVNIAQHLDETGLAWVPLADPIGLHERVARHASACVARWRINVLASSSAGSHTWLPRRRASAR